MKIMCRMSLESAGVALQFDFPMTDYNLLAKVYDNKRFDRALGIQPWFSATTKGLRTGPESRSLQEAISATKELMEAVESKPDELGRADVVWPKLLPKLLHYLESVKGQPVHVTHHTRAKLWAEIVLDFKIPAPNKHDESLAHAVFAKSLASMRSSISNGANPNLTDASGTSMLARASADCPELIEVLIEAGADPNGRFTFRSRVDKTVRGGQVALMSAGSEDAVRVLVRHGADLNAQDVSGNTPLMWAVIWENEEVVRTLLALGADKLITRAARPKRQSFTALEIAKEQLDGYLAADPKGYTKPEYLQQHRARYQSIVEMLK